MTTTEISPMEAVVLSFRAIRGAERQVDAAVAKLGLSSAAQAVAIVSLASLPPPVKMVDLAAALGQLPQSLTSLVDRLAKQGLVERLNGTLADRRIIPLALTEEGRALCGAIQATLDRLPPEIISFYREIRTVSTHTQKPEPFMYTNPE